MVIAGESLRTLQWLDSLHLWHKRDPQSRELAVAPWWPTRLADLIGNPVYRGHYWMTRAECDPVTGKALVGEIGALVQGADRGAGSGWPTRPWPGGRSAARGSRRRGPC